MKTAIKEKIRIEPKQPLLIEGLPGLGMVGRIATRYLMKKLKAEKFAYLYSPHFPYYVIVNKKGNARLLRGEFSYWRNSQGNDLVFFTGDSQAQTIEGQYEIAETILDFAKKSNVRAIITLGGYRKEAGEMPEVVATATDTEMLAKALKADAATSPPGNPIVGTAGLLVGMAKFKGIPALCLLGETRGYLPDPKAAKSLLMVLQKMLNITVDLEDLDKEIRKSDKILEKMRQIEARRETYSKKMRKGDEGKTTYIS
ncbi:MAG: proteasome assembly chaperone family protein [Candidatus Bathyarchaeota archaeon]|nr:MAG: proteasome assembly chaperone family protein [Candidatus Bathyarchaeota archaeon]